MSNGKNNPGGGSGQGGNAPGGGSGGGSGQGRGSGRGAGGVSTCKCPSCGHEEPHQRGQPCVQKNCPECGTRMVGKW